MDMQPLLNELAKQLIPLVIENLNPEELDFFKGEEDNEIDNDVLAEALRHCLREGWVDEEIESRIDSVINNGSWDFDISFSA
tara:strand:- start:144 stop:389 length:246 start_codon:yes stop_codon:yes gene_type:complete